MLSLRYPVLTVALALGACCSAPRGVASNDRALVAELEDRVVHLQVVCADGLLSGSGVIMQRYQGGTLIATAYHVVSSDCPLSVEGKGAAKVMATDPDHDIAIIWVDAMTNNPPLRMSNVYRGMDIVAVGYPLQRLTGKACLQVTKGVVATDQDGRYKITSDMWFGSSGGGVFDREGNLVGISVSLVQGSPYNAPSEYYATPAAFVFDLLEQI